MKPLSYILDDDGNPVPENDLGKWAEWMMKADRTVAKTTVREILISTVFLTHDHNWSGIGPPVLWETMVFGGKLHQEERRYTSRADAEAGHQEMVRRVIASLTEQDLLGMKN